MDFDHLSISKDWSLSLNGQSDDIAFFCKHSFFYIFWIIWQAENYKIWNPKDHVLEEVAGNIISYFSKHQIEDSFQVIPQTHFLLTFICNVCRYDVQYVNLMSHILLWCHIRCINVISAIMISNALFFGHNVIFDAAYVIVMSNTLRWHPHNVIWCHILFISRIKYVGICQMRYYLR